MPQTYVFLQLKFNTSGEFGQSFLCKNWISHESENKSVEYHSHCFVISIVLESDSYKRSYQLIFPESPTPNPNIRQFLNSINSDTYISLQSVLPKAPYRENHDDNKVKCLMIVFLFVTLIFIFQLLHLYTIFLPSRDFKMSFNHFICVLRKRLFFFFLFVCWLRYFKQECELEEKALH